MKTSPEGLSNFPRITGRAKIGPRFLLPLPLQSLLLETYGQATVATESQEKDAIKAFLL